MIKPETKVSIQRIPLECLQVGDFDQRYTSMVLKYVEMLRENPNNDAGLFRVRPSKIHKGLYTIEDGHHKFCAYIIAGRREALCIVIEEEGEAPTPAPFEEWHEEAIRERIPHVIPRTQYQRYREMGHNPVGALLMVIENLVYAGRSAVIEEPPRDEVGV